MAERKKLWRAGIVVVPDIVMHHLEMPQALASARVEGQQAIAEEVGAGTVRAVEIVFGAGGGHVDNTALLVERKLSPAIHAANVFPGVFRPGIGTKLAGARDRVKGPHKRAGKDVVGTDVARRRGVSFI